MLPNSFLLKFFFLLQNPVLYVIPMVSVLGKLFPAGESRTIPLSQLPITRLSVSHWQEGTTPVLFGIRYRALRALATVADCSISMCLPLHCLVTNSKCAAVVTVLFSDFGS